MTELLIYFQSDPVDKDSRKQGKWMREEKNFFYLFFSQAYER